VVCLLMNELTAFEFHGVAVLMDTEMDALGRLHEVVPMGGAICLVGAGFSMAATDQQGNAVPSSQELIKEIKAAVEIDPAEDASLTDIADFCDGDARRQQILRRILVNRLTLCHPSDAQRVVANQPWRSVFTTNFDDTLERCLPNGKYQVITPTSDSTNRVLGKLPLYYMHGRAKDLLESDKDPHLVISERNYLNLHEENRELYAQLKNEIFCANVIVIVGYSMRDLEIARILIESGYAFHRKTVLICGPSEKQLSISRLSKFGYVLPIGLIGLAAELERAKLVGAVQWGSLQFVEDVKPIDVATEIEGDDFVKLILTDHFSRAKYQFQLRQEKNASELYCVRRGAALDIIVNRVEDGSNRFLISSDIGNGKSVFLEQLTIELIAAGYRVIRISSRLNEVFSELEDILKSHEQTAFLIDDVIRYRNVAQFIGSRLNAYCLLVCCTRADADDVQFKELSNALGGAVRQVDLNRLSSEELQNWDRALERWGLWEQRISRSAKERLEFLARDCGAENRSIVLSLFRSSQIATKIDQIVAFFLRSGPHSRAFAALLISSLCQQHVGWESLVSWLKLDEQRLRSDIRTSEIADLFSNGRDWNMFTSSQLAEYILRTKYVVTDKDTLVDVFSTIVLGTAESATDSSLGAIFRENLKELMKFRFLTRLFGGDPAALTFINRVYKRLSNAAFIRNNPQFWLQYAMSRMEVDDLENAETYLNTALGLAEQRGREYSPYQILDQRARMYFRKNSKVQGKFKLAEVRAALESFSILVEDKNREIIYLFRSVPLIRDFVDVQIDDCDTELRGAILKLLEQIKAAGDGYSNFPRSQKGETKELRRALNEVMNVLHFA
jgi:hypothetical protein